MSERATETILCQARRHAFYFHVNSSDSKVKPRRRRRRRRRRIRRQGDVVSLPLKFRFPAASPSRCRCITIGINCTILHVGGGKYIRSKGGTKSREELRENERKLIKGATLRPIAVSFIYVPEVLNVHTNEIYKKINYE